MFHTIAGIDSRRTGRRPARLPLPFRPKPLPSWPSTTYGQSPRVTATAFDTRARSVLTAALRLALSQEFDGADLPLHTLPDWFLTATGPGRGRSRTGWTSSTSTPSPAAGVGGT